MHTLKLRHEVLIHALTTKLWKVLTSAEYTEQFLLEGKMVCDWIEGKPILLVEDTGAHRKVTTIGQVEVVVPGISLRFRLSSPVVFFQHPILFHYELSPNDEGIRLSLVQEADIPAEIMSTFREYGKMMLQKIKWLAEYS